MRRFGMFAWLVLALAAVSVTSCPVLDDPEEEEEPINDGSEPDPQGGGEAPAPEEPNPPH